MGPDAQGGLSACMSGRGRAFLSSLFRRGAFFYVALTCLFLCSVASHICGEQLFAHHHSIDSVLLWIPLRGNPVCTMCALGVFRDNLHSLSARCYRGSSNNCRPCTFLAIRCGPLLRRPNSLNVSSFAPR